MNSFKKQWEITKNWQLSYPIIAIIALGYSAYKIGLAFNFSNGIWSYLIAGLSFFVLFKLTFLLFNFLHKRWNPKYKWQVIRIFLIFAITGSMSVVVTNPIFNSLGFVKSNFIEIPMGIAIYYVLKFLLILPFYKVLLVFFGWLFGEYKFFLNFALKMASRIGLKRIVEKFAPKH